VHRRNWAKGTVAVLLTVVAFTACQRTDPTITTSAFPVADVGTSITVPLTATGGTGAYRWTAVGLPAGLKLQGRTLTGTPTKTGSSNVALTVTDAAKHSARRTVRLLVQTSAHAHALELLNADRTRLGVGPVTRRTDISDSAQRWAEQMVANGDISHTFDPAKGQIPAWIPTCPAGSTQLVGENVGKGPSLEYIETKWIHSASHLRNIKNPALETVGIGVAEGSGGELFVAEMFYTGC